MDAVLEVRARDKIPAIIEAGGMFSEDPARE